jgi:hypothetical protein
MKRTILLCTILLAAVSLQADRITSTAIACPTMEAFRALKKMPPDENRELYIMKQGCVVLTPKDKIHVIEPDHATHGRFLRIQLERTNETMYVNKNYVKVEQSGKGNIFRF